MAKKSANKARKRQDRRDSRDFAEETSWADDKQSCVSCDAVLQDDARFCDQCGCRLQPKTSEPELKRDTIGNGAMAGPTLLRADSSDRDRSSAQDSRDTPGGSWFWGTAHPATALIKEAARFPSRNKREPKDHNPRSLGYQTSNDPLSITSLQSNNNDQSARALQRSRRVGSASEVQLGTLLTRKADPAILMQLPPIGTSSRHLQPQPLKKPNHGDHSAIVNSSDQGSVKPEENVSAANKFALWGPCLDEAVSSFQATEIILVAEIDADERCMSFLKQQVQLSHQQNQQCHVGGNASKLHRNSPQLTQLELKLVALEKKLLMNKRKLVSVRQRLDELRTSSDATRFGGGNNSHAVLIQRPPISFTTTRVCVCPQKGRSVEPRRRAYGRRRETRASDAVSPSYKTPILSNLRAVLAIQRTFRNFRRVSRWKDAVAANVTTNNSQLSYPTCTSYPLKSPENTSVSSDTCVTSSSRSLESAAVCIQSLYRRRAGRAALRRLLAEVYEKMLDSDSNSYYYYSRRTKQSTWEKPVLLGGHDLADSVGNGEIVEKIDISGDSFSQERHQAAQAIQRLYRTRATRLFLRDLATGTLEKVFDADFGAWYYFNHRTQQSFWEKPHHAQIAATREPLVTS